MSYIRDQKGLNPNQLGTRIPQYQVSKRKEVSLLPIEVSEELDFGNYFYTVRSGSKVLGIFTRQLNSNIFIAKAFYHNPGNIKTQHKSEEEAVGTIISAYTAKVSFIPRSEPSQVSYHLTLESIEVDEFGIPDE